MAPLPFLSLPPLHLQWS